MTFQEGIFNYCKLLLLRLQVRFKQKNVYSLGMVRNFCRELGWWSLEVLISHFASRVDFGVQSDILALIQVPNMTSRTARVLYNHGKKSCEIDCEGYKTVESVAFASVDEIEWILKTSIPFKSKKNQFQKDDRKVNNAIRKARLVVTAAQQLLRKKLCKF
jgi:hypothetical protein